MRAARLIGLVLVTAACNTPSRGDAPDAAASPQASAMPAPLAVAPVTASGLPASMPEGGPPPTPLRGDTPLPADSLARETIGYTLSAALRPSDLVMPPRAPEVNTAGIETARKKTELRLAIDLGPSRMRVVLLGPGWVLPEDTEIRARADRYGHVVVWPGAATYRPLAPGAMRALFGERRFDLSPIGAANVVDKDEIGKRIGIRTRKVEVSTRAAKATFEVGKLPDLGEGGVLLCRLLLDLMNAPPNAAACGLDELPLRAELRWTTHGSVGFELTGVLRKTDMATSGLLVPPASASFANAPMPAGGITTMLTATELGAFRTNVADIPPGPFANGEGLVVANATDQMRVLYIDGVSVAWAAPGARDVVRGLPRGRYVSQWRTFLGESVDPPVAQSVPGLAQIGGADAGVR
jgi:hypothetical protein